MKSSFAYRSIAFFIISLGLLALLTVFEASLINLSTAAERIVSALLLVLPAVIGVLMGILSLSHKEAKRRLAVLGIALNSIFALFHVLVLSFAG